MFAILFFVLGLAQQGQAAMPVLARASSIADQIIRGETAPVVAQFNDQLKAALPEERLQQVGTSLTAQAGAFQQQTGLRLAEAPSGVSVVIVTCQFERASVDVVISFDAANRMAGLQMRPTPSTAAYVAPAYVTPSSFSERDVTVDAGGWPLPGTLTMPTGTGPFPAVVLVHGSGPSDRDETQGPNKPFRDLAWGLASRGIAVVRYDKRTMVHARRIVGVNDFTVGAEVVDDALAAVKVLRETAGVKADRVFVVGHSLGGMLAPRIGAREPGLAGLVILAGATQPLEVAIVRQTRYLAMLDGTITPAEQKQIDAVVGLEAAVRAAKPGDPPIGVPPFVAPASYWLDLRGYSPPASAKVLRQPMLVLQGERDYQVTMDDFAAWRMALTGRDNVTLRSYPSLNHLFMPGSGAGNPMEYLQTSHVDGAVVADVAAWIAR